MHGCPLSRGIFKPQGFTLFEILVAMALLGLLVLPILKSFGPSLASISHVEKQVILTNQARATLNRILSMEFNTLVSRIGNPVDPAVLFGSTAEAQKENFLVQGKTYTPGIVIQDASGGNKTLLELTVTLDNFNLVTLKAGV